MARLEYHFTGFLLANIQTNYTTGLRILKIPDYVSFYRLLVPVCLVLNLFNFFNLNEMNISFMLFSVSQSRISFSVT